MTENRKPQSDENRWSRVNSRARSREEVKAPAEPDVEVGAVEARGASLVVPEAVAITTPGTEGPGGFLMKWQKRQIDRKTAIDALQAHYNAQLEVLGYQLRSAVTVSKARADRIAEEFLTKLDSEHIQVLKEMGLRNAEVRATAMIQVRDMIAAKLKDVQDKDWPEQLVNRAIDDLLDLERRVCSEMMKELGS
jgi:hypothetical protein